MAHLYSPLVMKLLPQAAHVHWIVFGPVVSEWVGLDRVAVVALSSEE